MDRCFQMEKSQHLKEAGLSKENLSSRELLQAAAGFPEHFQCQNPQLPSKRYSDASPHPAPSGRIELQLQLLCLDNYNLLLCLYQSSVQNTQTTLAHINLNQQLKAHPLSNVYGFLFKTVFLYSAAHHSCQSLGRRNH